MAGADPSPRTKPAAKPAPGRPKPAPAKAAPAKPAGAKPGRPGRGKAETPAAAPRRDRAPTMKAGESAAARLPPGNAPRASDGPRGRGAVLGTRRGRRAVSIPLDGVFPRARPHSSGERGKGWWLEDLKSTKRHLSVNGRGRSCARSCSTST